MRIWGITDRGLVRKENQDTFIFHTFDDGAYGFAAVCDGMGGARAGGVASRQASEVFQKELLLVRV